MRFYLLGLFFLCCITFLMSCATPTQPTGGPPDETPPSIERTTPEQGTVNFSDDEIRFYFDKYVNRESFVNAFRIDPDLQLDYNLKWSGKSVRVRFEDSLPDSTTIIFTIGTDFADTNRNRIRSPFVLALSTGDTIDDGKIEGKIRDGKTGKPMESATVLLYREPFDLSVGADYVSETDSAGKVQFAYLRDGDYKVFWLDDRNRNRIWDVSTESARPFNTNIVQVNQNEPSSVGIIYVDEPDTIRPALQGVGMLSDVRLRLRYSRSMRLEDGAEVSIIDSTGNLFTEAVPLYTDPNDQSVLFAQTRNQIPENETFKVQTQNILDIHGNEPNDDSPEFEGSASSDTTRVRLIRHLTDIGVLDNEPHIFQFSAFLEGDIIMDSLLVVQDEIIYTDWEPLEVEDNLLFLYPPEKWKDGSDYTVRFFDVTRGAFNDIPLKIWQRARLGAIEITFEDTPGNNEAEHFIEVFDTDQIRVFGGRTTEMLEVPNLPAGDYIVKSFRDENGDGIWNRGIVEPFSPPEPIVIKRGVRVLERMTGELELSYTEETSQDSQENPEGELKVNPEDDTTSTKEMNYEKENEEGQDLKPDDSNEDIKHP